MNNRSVPTARARSLPRVIGRVAAIFMISVMLLLAIGVALAWAPDRSVESLRARWAPPPSVFVPIDGMRVHLRDQGPQSDPEPIVLIHGTSASLHTWEPWAHTLSARRRVITFDLPGFGLTGPDPTGDYTIARYVRFVLHVLDERGISHCVLGGNSLGGAIAWETAVRAPERVSRLVLVDAGGFASTPASMPLAFRLVQIPIIASVAQHLLTRSLIERSVRDVYGDPSRVTPALVDRYYEITLREGNRAAVAQRFRQVRPGEHEQSIRTIHTPTLILWGGRDRLIPPINGQRFRDAIVGSRLVIFPALGHVPHEENPSATVVVVQEFVE